MITKLGPNKIDESETHLFYCNSCTFNFESLMRLLTGHKEYEMHCMKCSAQIQANHSWNERRLSIHLGSDWSTDNLITLAVKQQLNTHATNNANVCVEACNWRQCTNNQPSLSHKLYDDNQYLALGANSGISHFNVTLLFQTSKNLALPYWKNHQGTKYLIKGEVLIEPSFRIIMTQSCSVIEYISSSRALAQIVFP